MRAFTAPAFVVFLSAAVTIGAQQGPPRDARSQKPTTGIIRGRVVAADTGMPLRRARVTVSAPELSTQRAAETDLEGRYGFTELPAGRYRVRAAKGLFVPIEYGQRLAFEGGRTIDLADDATLDKIDLALPRGGVISGQVVDDLGEPVAWARVSAMRSRYEQGKRKLLPVGRPVVTNDLGQYRLYGLPPGSYAVGSVPEPTASDDGYPFAPAYYPGTQNPAHAQRVSVRVGQERGGVDFVQPPGRLVTVSGTVIDSRGRSVAGASVGLVDVGAGSMLSSRVNPDGTFAVSNIAPGDYGVAVRLQDPVTGILDMIMVPVTVLGEDVAGLVLPVVPGSRITGRVVTVEGVPPPFTPSGLRVSPNPLPSGMPTRIAMGGTSGAINSDWTFEVTGFAGSLLFRIGKLPQGWMMKSVSLNGRDITDEPLDVKGTEEIADLEITLTNRVTEVRGVAIDALGRSVQEYAVVVFAEEASRWTWPSRFLATARPDQQGRFRLANLPAGRYLAIALEYLDEGQSEDPEFLESLRAKATAFTLGEGDSKALELKVVRIEG